MAYDLEEQESLDELKAWWAKWGNAIVGVVTVGCLAFAGYNGMKWYERNQAAEAGIAYASLQESLNQRSDLATVKQITDAMIDKDSSSIYAALGALNAAAYALNQGDRDTAIKYLTWVVEKADRQELDTVARVRLAALLIDQKKLDQAQAVLDAANPTERDQSLLLDQKGDLALAQNNLAEARTMWEKALTLPMDPSLTNFVQLKLQALPQS